MTKFYRFKIAFFPISVGMTVGMIVYGLFDIDLSNLPSIGRLAGKSLLMGVIEGALFGLLNMFFKVLPIKSLFERKK